MGKFNCEVCGSCCRSIGKLVISCIATLDEAEKTGQEVLFEGDDDTTD